MAFIAMVSAQGSPGVSTTALGMALAWPRPCLLVDADPSAASAWLAGYFRGAVPEAATGLLGLATRPVVEVIDRDLLGASFPITGTQVRIVPGLESHGQSPGLAPLWGPLATSLHKLDATGQDVLVDAGRLGLSGSPTPLLAAADLVLLVVRSHLPALVGARGWVDDLTDLLPLVGEHPRVCAVVVGPGRPYRAEAVADAIGIPVVATLPWAPDDAAVLAEGERPVQDWNRGRLVKSLWSAAQSVAAAAAENRMVLSQEETI